ncbi:MAG TPA: ureidoglycolate lyase [Chloroflexota bacterium]|jgi:ureidoglycolate lyase|nr:ureidoglycolate lyase [Chloroflexota bacterium]
MSAVQTTVIRVRAEPLTAEAYAPFGKVVAAPRHRLGCEPGQYTARLMPLEPVPERFVRINRHFDHEQLFVPLSGGPLLLVVAPKELPGEGFDPSQVRAFVNDGGLAWTYGVGVWHFAPRAIGGAAAVLNVQGSRYLAHTEIVAMEPAVAVEL